MTIRHRSSMLHAALLATGLFVGACPLATVAQAADEAVGTKLSDATITGKIKAKLMADEHTKAFDINVDTDADGRVTLRGAADSVEAKRAATAVARSVDGVRSVDNQLVVGADPAAQRVTASGKARHAAKAGAEHVDDAWITTKVKSELVANDEVKARDIEVTTNDGVVTLAGTLHSRAERDRAMQITRDVKGVRRVDGSALKVD